MATEIGVTTLQNVTDLFINANKTNSAMKDETPSLKNKTSQQQLLLPNIPPYNYPDFIPVLNYPPDSEDSPNQRPILPPRFIPFRYQQRPFFYFLTTSSQQHKQLKESHIFEQTGELLLLAVIIGMWLSAIAVFLHRWRSIRIVRAPETRMASYRPKNLEAIKIVAKHRDSVIYKNLPENMSRTLEARQKRLSRMSTVPNIKLGEQLQQLLPQTHSLLFNPLLLQQQQHTREAPVYCFGRPQSLPQLQEFLQHQLLQQLQLLRQTQHTNLQTTLSPQPEEDDEQPEQEEQQNTIVSIEEIPQFSSSKENVNHIQPCDPEFPHKSDLQQILSSEEIPPTTNYQPIDDSATTAFHDFRQRRHNKSSGSVACFVGEGISTGGFSTDDEM